LTLLKTIFFWWSFGVRNEDPKKFIEDALSPAKILEVKVNEAEKQATVTVSEDQQSLAIGKGGQNVRLAAKLTGWKIDIQSVQKDGSVAETETLEK
jgi:N utilization substance protein A